MHTLRPSVPRSSHQSQSLLSHVVIVILTITGVVAVGTGYAHLFVAMHHMTPRVSVAPNLWTQAHHPSGCVIPEPSAVDFY